MFVKLDDWMFNQVFQPFADWFCDRSGRNPFWLAATCMYLFIAGTIVGHVLFKSSLFAMIFNAFVCIYLLFRAFSYDRKSIAPNKTAGTLNPNRMDKFFRFLRLSSIAIFLKNVASMFIPHSGHAVTHSDSLKLFLIFIFLLILYFDACETKPPAPPKQAKRPRERAAA